MFRHADFNIRYPHICIPNACFFATGNPGPPPPARHHAKNQQETPPAWSFGSVPMGSLLPILAQTLWRTPHRLHPQRVSRSRHHPEGCVSSTPHDLLHRLLSWKPLPPFAWKGLAGWQGRAASADGKDHCASQSRWPGPSIQTPSRLNRPVQRICFHNVQSRAARRLTTEWFRDPARTHPALKHQDSEDSHQDSNYALRPVRQYPVD
jgi:hypothetical protein